MVCCQVSYLRFIFLSQMFDGLAFVKALSLPTNPGCRTSRLYWVFHRWFEPAIAAALRISQPVTAVQDGFYLRLPSHKDGFHHITSVAMANSESAVLRI
jgi:hypothetical protein